MKVKFAALAGAIAAVAAVVVGVGTSTASATPPATTIRCLPGWYVNLDEAKLLPVSQVDGLLFDGPSLIHHVTSGALADAALDGSFTVSGAIVGAKPLFKLETGTPYSTINKTADGKYWSSKIPSGVGSQASPTTLALLATTTPYNKNTTVVSFGVGYANDAGNKALVTSVTYAGKKYSLLCCPPKPTHTSTPTSTPSTTVPTTTVTRTSTPAPSTINVPVTPPVRVIVVNPRQFAITPNTSKGVDTGDGSLS